MKIINFIRALFSKNLSNAPIVWSTPRLFSANQRFEEIGFGTFKDIGGNTRLWNKLLDARIQSPFELSSYSGRELLTIPGLGSRTLIAAQDVLHYFDLTVGCNVNHNEDKAGRAERTRDLNIWSRRGSTAEPKVAPVFQPCQHADGSWELCNRDFDAIQKAWIIPELGSSSCPIPIDVQSSAVQ